MQKDFLGDALDWWKGSILEFLRQNKLNFKVLPCLPDGEKWKEEEWGLYAKLLKIPPESIDKDAIIKGGKFIEAFAQDPNSDYFLDPDTGIRTAGIAKSSNSHIDPEQIQSLLGNKRDRVIMIYQHGSRSEDINERVNTVLKHLRETTSKELEACAVTSKATHSAMLFMSYDGKRISDIYEHFSKLFGPEISKVRLYRSWR